MATGALDANGIWQYGEDDSNTTFSALLNRLGASASTQVGALKASKQIKQIVPYFTSTRFTTTSSTHANTNIQATITPTSSTSKILVFFNVNGIYKQNSAGAEGWFLIRRNGSTTIADQRGQFYDGLGGTQTGFGYSLVLQDTPGTTSAVTYSLWAAILGGGTLGVNASGGGASGENTSSILLIEVAA